MFCLRRCLCLAEGGLLEGRTATCHWGHAELFRHRFPEIKLNADPIFIHDGKVYTSAGATAGIDLALALIEEDLGPAAALEVARSMVVFLRRPGSQSQFSVPLSLRGTDEQPLREVCEWMQDHLGSELTLASLAARAGMSPRNFARQFRREMGTSPARYVDRLRTDLARRRLEESAKPLKAIALETGFGAVETMRRSFRHHLQTTPGSYRRRFQSAALSMEDATTERTIRRDA